MNDVKRVKSSRSRAVIYDYRVARARGPLSKLLQIVIIVPGNEETMRDPTLRGNIT